MQKSSKLIKLIRSLSKGEKRNFKILSAKSGRKGKNYVTLYDWIEKKGSLDEVKFLSANQSIKPTQLPNIKNNLYRQILKSIREISKDNYEEIRTREYFDFAKILYSKGDYASALEYLSKAKKLGAKIKKSTLIFLATDFEKQIETQHITGSMSKKAAQLADYSSQLLKEINLTNAFSNLSLLLYGRYLKKGFAKNEYDEQKLSEFFYDHLPEFEIHELDFTQLLHLYQSYVWYHYMLRNYAENFKYALKWYNLFNQFPEMRDIERTHYIKSLHNILSALFAADKQDKFLDYYNKLVDLAEDDSNAWNTNELNMLSLFSFIHGINKIFLLVEYRSAENEINNYQEIIQNNPHNWDNSRLVVFYYKLGCVFFGRGDYEKTLYWLNRIINETRTDNKEDIQCFARILSLITHYELGNDLHISYQIISVYRFLLKMKQLGKVQRAIFNFLRKSVKFDKGNMIPEFQALKDELIEITEDAYERRAFMYLDLLSWLDSKIMNITMIEAIRINR